MVELGVRKLMRWHESNQDKFLWVTNKVRESFGITVTCAEVRRVFLELGYETCGPETTRDAWCLRRGPQFNVTLYSETIREIIPPKATNNTRDIEIERLKRENSKLKAEIEMLKQRDQSPPWSVEQ
jgi:hypothetical protein